MNGNEGLTASDVALLTGNNDSFGGNGGWGGMIWLFAILALMGGWGNGGFGGGGGYRPQYATQDFVQAGMNFSDLQNQNRDILTAIANGTASAVSAAKEAEYESVAVAKDIQGTIISQIGDVRTNQMQLLANQNDCCCSTKMALADGFNGVNAAIAQARYENAMNTAAINANTTAQTQRIIDMMTGNTIQDLRDQVQGLQLANQLQGVMRYPQGWTYNAGMNPFCNNGCGCGMNM